MFLVSGATGKVGRSVVRRLAERGHPVRALVRTPETANLPGRVEAALADYDRLELLEAAFLDVQGLFLMAPVALLEDHAAKLVAAARRAGVERMVLLSSLSVEMDHGNAFREEHQAVEAMVRNSGCDWTILRAGEMASNTLSWANSVKTSLVVRPFVRNDSCARIDPFDVGAVAARVMSQPDHSGKIYALTGGEATTPQQCTKILGDLLGVELHFEEMTDEEAGRAWIAIFGDTSEARERIRTLREPSLPWLAVRDTTSRLLDRRPRSYREWASANIAAFR